MKIKLIQPRMSLRPMDSEFKRRMSPSLALLILAALTPDTHEVCIEDENITPIDFGDTPDLVGITVNVDTSTRAYQIASAFRAKGVPVVAGGIHPSSSPDEALQHFDSICIGEAEEQWPRILQDLLQGQLKREYKSDAPVAPASIPMPRRSLIAAEQYLYTNVCVTSRGCPFRCEFCYNSCDYTHKRFQTRPIDHVLEEIAQLGTKHVMFIDDNFIGDPEWTRVFLQRIKPLGLKWNAAVSSNVGKHLDLLDEMKASGCQSLFIGFESINQLSVSSVGKHQNKVQSYEALIRELHEREIMINASLVFGFDHDTPSVFQETLDWLVEHRIETMTAHILTPYPGTILYNRLQQEGRIIDRDLSHYNTAHVVFQPAQMSAQQLLDGYLWMYREFYAFRNILRRMPESGARRIPYLLFNLFYRKMGGLTSALAKHGAMNLVGRVARRISYGIQ